MNPKAVELYQSHNIDLYKEPLEIAVCAQHHNGGIAVDANWKTNISGLYAAGECAGSFGVYRPGGSALNSTQTGSMRAAEHICRTTKEHTPEKVPFEGYPVKTGSGQNPMDILKHIQSDMSKYAAYNRSVSGMKELYREIFELHNNFFERVLVKSKNEFANLYTVYDIITAAAAVLSAMIYSAENIGTRGGAITDGDGNDDRRHMLTVTHGFDTAERPVRPLPVSEQWFETVWNQLNMN
jgi:succinate dehydrogenase/fumarate reductase flavoprotein subunit